MRLIDADAFISYLGLDCENSKEENIGEIVTLEDFDRQPTAYDLNEVVKRIDNEVTGITNLQLIKIDEIIKAGYTE